MSRGASPGIKRIALALEYDGSQYHGWQAQRRPGVPTIQEFLESALSQVADQPIRVHCAGRTDAGVHATNQIVHFETTAERDAKAWVFGTNAALPRSISVRWAQPVVDDFHARFSAVSRRYRYVIYNHPVRPSLFSGQLTWERRLLDHQLMHREGQCLLGEQDFTSFRAVACQSKSPFRNVHHLHVWRRDDLVVMEIQANAFVHHMVRNIAGVLMAVGSGKANSGWIKDVLDAKDRTMGGVTAPSYGLYLVDVGYPPQFQIPVSTPGPLFISN